MELGGKIMSRLMKCSGIPWIGEIPESWGSDTIGSLYSLRGEKVSDKDYPPLSVTKKGVVPQLETAAKTNDGDNRKLVRKGDFAINSRSDRRGSCGISDFDGSVSLINTILTPRTTMNPRYYNWLFHTELFADEFYKWGHGIVDDLWTTGWQEMKKISIIVPPQHEQQAISDFLDKKCSEIDEVITLQEKIIEELKAYKQSVITETVTKGLNSNVPMKDSGIEWLERIPEMWKEGRLKNVFRLKTGATPNGFDARIEEHIIPWYTPTDIYEDGNEIVHFERTLNYSIIVNEGIALFPEHSLLFVGIGASAGKIGYALYEGYSNQQITALIPTHCISKFFFYYLIADRKRLRDNAFFTTLPIINNSYLSEEKIVIPPIEEQQAIADYLDNKCSEIDSLISLKQSKIESLKEYKKSIIYEYVTGKKEVNG